MLVERYDYEFALAELAHTGGLPPDVRDQRASARYSSCSLGIENGPVLVCFAEGIKSGVTSQIGTKLAVDAILRETQQLFHGSTHPLEAADYVKTGFREANRELYRYGTKMLSGGKIAVHGVVACFDGEKLSIGRTGEYESYLFRDGKIAQFFGKEISFVQPAGVATFERVLGASKQVLVDIASLKVEVGDKILVTTVGFSEHLLGILGEALEVEDGGEDLVFDLLTPCTQSAIVRSEENEELLERNVLLALFEIEPPLFDPDA